MLSALSAATIGAVLANRRPHHPVGCCCWPLGLSVVVDGVANGYVAYLGLVVAIASLVVHLTAPAGPSTNSFGWVALGAWLSVPCLAMVLAGGNAALVLGLGHGGGPDHAANPGVAVAATASSGLARPTRRGGSPMTQQGMNGMESHGQLRWDGHCPVHHRSMTRVRR